MSEAGKLVKIKEQHVPLERFIRQETVKFEVADGGFEYVTNEKIEESLQKYDKLLSDIDEVKGKSMTSLFCVKVDYQRGEHRGKLNTYQILKYVIEASTHYIRIDSKKDAYDDWIGYISEIKSAENAKFVSGGEWGYDYTLSLDGEEMEASTHPSSWPYYWIFNRDDVVELMKKDGIQLCGYGPLARRDFKFELFPENEIPVGAVEMVN